MARNKFLKPTQNIAFKILGDIDKIDLKIKTESQAEEFIYAYLKEFFEVVAQQYHLSGFRGHKIDIDIGHGTVGVEVKLAKSLLGNVGEIYRCIGQAIIYSEKQYSDDLILVIVGLYDEINHHEIDELTDILSENDISSICIECK